MKRALLAVVAAIAAAVVLPIAAGIASAHNNFATGSAVCAENGTYTVTWTIGNNFTTPVTVTATAGGRTLTVSPNPIPPLGSATAVHTGIPGTATGVSLSVHGVWTDQTSNDTVSSVALAGTCVRSTRHVITGGAQVHGGRLHDHAVDGRPARDR